MSLFTTLIYPLSSVFCVALKLFLRPWLTALLWVSIAGCTPEAYKPPAAGGAAVTIGGASTGASEQASFAASASASPALPVGATAARYPLEGICEVKPKTLVPIKSQANGEVTAVHVDVGDSVRKGQVLIEISPRDLTERMQRNRLARERVEKRMALIALQITQKKGEAAALQQLYSEAGNAKALVAIRERETELESAKIELREFELTQRELDRELRYTQIQSPSDGTVVKRTVEPGQVVNAAGGSFGGGDGLLELADKSELQLDCAVHAEDADLIAQRVPLVVLLSRVNGDAAAITILRVAPMLDSRGQVPQLRFSARFTGSAPAQAMLGARYPLQRPKGKDKATP